MHANFWGVNGKLELSININSTPAAAPLAPERHECIAYVNQVTGYAVDVSKNILSMWLVGMKGDADINILKISDVSPADQKVKFYLSNTLRRN